MSAGTISISGNTITSSSSSDIIINAGVDASATLIINATDVSFNISGGSCQFPEDVFVNFGNNNGAGVNGTININTCELELYNHDNAGTSYNWLNISNMYPSSDLAICQFNSPNGSYFAINVNMLFNPAGYTAGYLYWSGDDGIISITSTPSSSRYKENIISLPEDRYNTETFEKLRPVQFNYIKDEPHIKRIGFIAEEFNELNLNELVIYNKEGQPDSIHYENTTSFIVKIVQEQQKQIKSQQLEIDGLKEDIKNLTSLVQGLLNTKP
jgi:hypothetical protein